MDCEQCPFVKRKKQEIESLKQEVDDSRSSLAVFSMMKTLYVSDIAEGERSNEQLQASRTSPREFLDEDPADYGNTEVMRPTDASAGTMSGPVDKAGDLSKMNELLNGLDTKVSINRMHIDGINSIIASAEGSCSEPMRCVLQGREIIRCSSPIADMDTSEAT